VDVTDAKGRALAGVHGHYDRGDDTSGVMEVRADQLVQNNAARFGPPDRLVWNEPIAARWINVPFEMTLDLR
jgi:hypothetical protein